MFSQIQLHWKRAWLISPETHLGRKMLHCPARSVSTSIHQSIHQEMVSTYRAYNLQKEVHESMTWNLVCWCILTTASAFKILVTGFLFSLFQQNFDSEKKVKLGFSGHLLEIT